MSMSSRAARAVLATVLALAVLAAPTALAAGKAKHPGRKADGPAGVLPDRVLHLGPLPAPPPDRRAETPALLPDVDPVPELDPARAWPRPGECVALAPGATATWGLAPAGKGGVRLTGAGVHWLFTRLLSDRFGEVVLDVEPGGGAKLLGLWVAGDEWDAGKAHVLPRADVPVLARVLLERDDAAVVLRATAKGGQRLAFRVTGPRVGARYEDWGGFVSLGPLAVAPGGTLVARVAARRGPDGKRHSFLDVLDARGRPVAVGLGGEGARPIAFLPDGRLLVDRPGKDGDDLFLWSRESPELVPVVRGEPDLSFVRVDPTGRFLLLASSRGATWPEADEEEPDRLVVLRDTLPDWDPSVHLHLVDLRTGARRRLVAPGDFNLEDACFSADGTKVAWARTVSIDPYPWFRTEFRELDLAGGEDRLLATFDAGWESRPANLAASPDGRYLAFTAPPEQVGKDHPPRNVYARRAWLLDLAGGELRRIEHGGPYAFDADADLLFAWDATGHSLLAAATEGSRVRIVRITPGRDGTPDRVEPFATAGMLATRAAISPDRSAVAYVAVGRTMPAVLALLRPASGEDRVLEDPNRELVARFRIVEPRDASFTGPGGQEIEAWWYPPVRDVAPPGEKVPLVVYFYGGATPRLRWFDTTSQFLAANGYAALVINPRGCYGYGEEFADVHAGDWGPKAGKDIVAGIDAFLAAHPEVDGTKVGIYGGSYGGFMTEYLVTNWPDRFAAAVSMYGISDITSYWGQGAWGWTYGTMASGGKLPWDAPHVYAGHSPVYHADRIVTPLLLLHGDADVNVPPGQSDELFAALRVQRKHVELVAFPGEDHGISGKWSNRVGHRAMILEWFDRWLRDEPAAWEHRWKQKE